MPLDRGIIDQQLQALGESARWWEHRELRDLPAVLHPDERLLAIGRGKIARVRWLHRTWLIVATDRRLLCLRSSRTSWRQVELSAEQITRVALRVGPFRGRVLVTGGGHTWKLLVRRPEAYRLSEALTSMSIPAREALTGFGPTRMVRRVIDHVLALPAAALDSRVPPPPPPPVPDTSGLERRCQLLEDQLHLLQQQVDFLEQLLQQRHQLTPAPGDAALPPAGGTGS